MIPRYHERTAHNGCYYKNKRLPNKMVGTYVKNGRSANLKNPFQI
jgi:hypothetical protein